MQRSSLNEPTGKLVAIEGIEYLLVDGKLYRYADMTLDKGFKIVSQEVRTNNTASIALHCSLGFETSESVFTNAKGNQVSIYLKSLF